MCCQMKVIWAGFGLRPLQFSISVTSGHWLSLQRMVHSSVCIYIIKVHMYFKYMHTKLKFLEVMGLSGCISIFWESNRGITLTDTHAFLIRQLQ